MLVDLIRAGLATAKTDSNEVKKRTRRSGTGFLLRPKDSALLRI
jgi:hypothetical protein